MGLTLELPGPLADELAREASREGVSPAELATHLLSVATALLKDDPETTERLVSGIADGCVEAECSLVGGETAILPDFYAPGDYDMAGFCVGVVEKDHLVNGKAVRPGDAVLGLASTGLHSNGYSLVRKVVFDHAGLTVDDFVPELGRKVGEELLEPTRIYVRPIKNILQHYPTKKRVVRGEPDGVAVDRRDDRLIEFELTRHGTAADHGVVDFALF